MRPALFVISIVRYQYCSIDDLVRGLLPSPARSSTMFGFRVSEKDQISHDKLLNDALAAIEKLREKGTRVHAITNFVAQNFSANILLACGATPSMTASREEAPYFTERADALLINLGTLDEERKAAIRASLEAAKSNDKPFILDPVMVHVSPPRAAFAAELLASRPTILRANAAEIETLENFENSASIHPDTLIVETGQSDLIRRGGQMLVRVENGHPLMAKVIATGCAQGALMAALLAHAKSAEAAALAALLWFGIAGEMAAKEAGQPGSFAPRFIDELAAIPLDEIAEKARLG